MILLFKCVQSHLIICIFQFCKYLTFSKSFNCLHFQSQLIVKISKVYCWHGVTYFTMIRNCSSIFCTYVRQNKGKFKSLEARDLLIALKNGINQNLDSKDLTFSALQDSLEMSARIADCLINAVHKSCNLSGLLTKRFPR